MLQRHIDSTANASTVDNDSRGRCLRVKRTRRAGRQEQARTCHTLAGASKDNNETVVLHITVATVTDASESKYATCKTSTQSRRVPPLILYWYDSDRKRVAVQRIREPEERTNLHMISPTNS
jgi:hypothetical protein